MLPEQAKNEPLTRKQLQKMDGLPVWIEFIPEPDGEQLKMWALASVDPEDGEIFLLNKLGGSSAYEEVWADIQAIYSRPPEAETKKKLTPCDCCAHDPPSSFGGKPCPFCPAEARPDVEEETP